MISETQKALVDMLRTKGTSQTAEQLTQTLQTLHWVDDDVRDAAAYFVQKSDEDVPLNSNSTPSSTIDPRFEISTKPRVMGTQLTPETTRYNVMPRNDIHPTVPASTASLFVGGPIDTQVPTERKTSWVTFICILFVFVLLGVAVYMFRDPIVLYVNGLMQKNTTEEIALVEKEIINTPLIEATTSASSIIPVLVIEQVEDPAINTNLQQQLQNVMMLRKAIATYTMLYGVYPDNLNQLTQPIASGTIQQGLVYPSIVRSNKPIILDVPRQVGVSSAYGYKKGNEDYDLTYNIMLSKYNVQNNIYSYIGVQRFDIATKKLLPVKRTNATFHEANYGLFKNDTDTLPTRLIQMMVQDGTNTATKIALSKEVWAKVEIDTDGDTLVDSLENYLGTNIQSFDSDQDGVSDRDEVRLKTNPTEKN